MLGLNDEGELAAPTSGASPAQSPDSSILLVNERYSSVFQHICSNPRAVHANHQTLASRLQ